MLLSQDEPILFGGVRLRGKIDRVELGDGIFVVIDYKTGSVVPALSDIRGGLGLQLPVYLNAVEHLLEASGRSGMTPAGGLYYRLRSQVELNPGVVVENYRGRAFPQSSRTKQVVEDEQELREIIRDAEKTVRQISERIAQGEFPLATLELVPEVCPVCPYKTVCRIQIQKHVSPTAQEEA
jgi:ATP-dependent helicase/DNAse subunit B